MCLILLAWRTRPDYVLVLAANRDEFFSRPSQAAAWWSDHSDILGGRDKRHGGSWLAIHRDGRFAAVTNHRNGRKDPPASASRGMLVAEYLRAGAPASEYLRRLPIVRKPYNLLLGDRQDLFHYSNITGTPRRIEAGIHGLSNHLLDTPWPKLRDGCQALRECLASEAPVRDEELFELLRDDTRAQDSLLPDTGIGLERERLLSSRFIRSPDYGTRCSTVLTISGDGKVHLCERTFDDRGRRQAEASYDFPVAACRGAPELP